MAGILAAGGIIDKLFDFARGSIGDASVSIQGWLSDSMQIKADGTQINSILEAYTQGLNDGAFTTFGGLSDTNWKVTVDYITAKTGADADLTYKVLNGLSELAKKGDGVCGKVLNGQGSSLIAGIGKALGEGLSDTLSGFAKGLGLSPTIFYIIILLVLAAGGYVVYRKIKG
jgi:hypothetical protein